MYHIRCQRIQLFIRYARTVRVADFRVLQRERFRRIEDFRKVRRKIDHVARALALLAIVFLQKLREFYRFRIQFDACLLEVLRQLLRYVFRSLVAFRIDHVKLKLHELRLRCLVAIVVRSGSVVGSGDVLRPSGFVQKFVRLRDIKLVSLDIVKRQLFPLRYFFCVIVQLFFRRSLSGYRDRRIDHAFYHLVDPLTDSVVAVRSYAVVAQIIGYKLVLVKAVCHRLAHRCFRYDWRFAVEADKSETFARIVAYREVFIRYKVKALVQLLYVHQLVQKVDFALFKLLDRFRIGYMTEDDLLDRRLLARLIALVILVDFEFRYALGFVIRYQFVRAAYNFRIRKISVFRIVNRILQHVYIDLRCSLRDRVSDVHALRSVCYLASRQKFMDRIRIRS